MLDIKNFKGTQRSQRSTEFRKDYKTVKYLIFVFLFSGLLNFFNYIPPQFFKNIRCNCYGNQIKNSNAGIQVQLELKLYL